MIFEHGFNVTNVAIQRLMQPLSFRSRTGASKQNVDNKSLWMGIFNTGQISLWFKRLFLLMLLLLAVAFISEGIKKVRAIPIGIVQFYGYSGGEESNRGATEEELHMLFSEHSMEGFWQLDLLRLQKEIESHAWVRKANISRQWPNNLQIGIDEYVPIARWNGSHLLASSGDLFIVNEAGIFSSLPQFITPSSFGKNNAMIKKMVVQFNDFQRLLKLENQPLFEVGLTASGDTWLVLRSGVKVELGRTDQLLRLKRLMSLVKSGAISNWDAIAVADLRYVNGLSVNWADNEFIEDEFESLDELTAKL